MTDQTYAYFDTSTWLKLYIREDGSKEARALARKYRLLSSSLLLLECFSALARKRETEDIEPPQMSQLIKKLRANVTSIGLVNISDPVLDKAQKVALHTLARTLDAVHIASALVFEVHRRDDGRRSGKERKAFKGFSPKGTMAEFYGRKLLLLFSMSDRMPSRAGLTASKRSEELRSLSRAQMTFLL